ncbi:MAG: CDP-alcohol phosphatidyltransferase family protein [Myxococcales bacterium]|nr:CDP-alcohol phosphatidyltransferase family protein [Myxococcales bacterium]
MDRERLRRIRNYQNTEFYPALVLRPASILITMVIGDWRWVTPNGVTLLATIFKLAAAAMFVVDDRAWLLAAVVTLQLGAILDHVDGTLARYRQTPSNLGFFYDTVSDAVTWFATLAALGWLAYQRTGQAHLLVVAGAGAYALMVNGYMRSVVETAEERRKWKDAVDDPVAAVAANAARQEGGPPPERTGAEWLRWLGRCVGQIWRFQEMDLFFWVAVFVVLDRIPELLWLVAVTQLAAMLIQFVARALRMRAFDLP